MTAARVFIPFAIGYFLSYLLRVVNAVIAPDLIDELGLDADELGLLTSVNFLAFAAFQLPLGILLDRYGPRRTESALLLFAAGGAALFAAAEGLGGLILGRALIGLGTSACLMAAFKAYVMWFPKERLPLINGCQMAAGGLGALTATQPVEAALAFTDWRGVFWALTALALFAAFVIFVAVPKRPSETHRSETFRQQLGGIGEVFTSSAFLRIAPLCVTSQAAFLSIQSLWSGPWLKDVAGLPRDVVADHLFLIACAMLAGFLGMGALAERLGRLGVPTMQVAVAGMAAFALAQAALVLQWTDHALAFWLVFGFFGTTGILPYAVLPQRFRPELAGRVITGLNVLAFFSAFAMQWGIGAIIDLWDRTPAGGYAAPGYAAPGYAAPGYAAPGYQAAFAVVLMMQVAGLLWYGIYRRD